MTAFSVKNFVTFIYAAFLGEGTGNSQLTPKRILYLVSTCLFIVLLETVVWIGFALDEIFFKGYRSQRIRQPVFIVGNPRSGTTFLQRLLAKDRRNFACMDMWEILFAPAISLRKLVWLLSTWDRRLGGPLCNCLSRWERRWQKENAMHDIALRKPEEDQYLLTHIWSTLAIWQISGILEEAGAYTHFDQAVSEAEKKRIMAFYERCIKRHLYAHDAADKHYLSKNPSSSPRIQTLYQFFPDAKIIYLVRNPLDVIPSYISLLDATWRLLGDPTEEYGCRDYVLEMTQHWYRYPLSQLRTARRESYVIVKFDDLVHNARQTVEEIYARFGFELGPAFARVLRAETEKARRYNSGHKYSLQEVGLSREQIVSDYEDIFERFGFDTRETEEEHQKERSRQRALES
ncbi:MAG: sulfotransferase [Chloroflexota bacterium]|nr:sulfotransferase [Chloroflexota bacterium]